MSTRDILWIAGSLFVFSLVDDRFLSPFLHRTSPQVAALAIPLVFAGFGALVGLGLRYNSKRAR
ncbi:hypothetical protein [Candidatus Korobacter versatilis]|uniref:hypothetical protein n=1 Tax=Candidatus Korobacter versatilis TaxID=658062 RepID=UPI000313C3DD|nr:hypothetical protein [Candidatus Koribacter versatilis]